MKSFIFLILCIYFLAKTEAKPVHDETDQDYVYSEAQLDNVRCIKESNYGGPTIIHHETDCAKYYMCMDGLSYEITCPKERYFDRETHTCESFEEARCSQNYS